MSSEKSKFFLTFYNMLELIVIYENFERVETAYREKKGNRKMLSKVLYAERLSLQCPLAREGGPLRSGLSPPRWEREGQAAGGPA